MGIGAGALVGLRRNRKEQQQEPNHPELPDGVLGEVVLSSVQEISRILRVADEVEASNPRVAYICRSYALDKAQRLDPTSGGPGAAQFKTELLQSLQREYEPTLKGRVEQGDTKEMMNFYAHYYKTYIQAPQSVVGGVADRAQLTKAYQTALVLFEVLKATTKAQFI